MYSKKAVFGITTLLLYIAIIIVAVVTVTVIFNVVEGSRSKVQRVALESQKQTAFMVDMLSVTGYGASNGEIDVLVFRLKLYSGATPINLYNTLFSILTENNSTDSVSGNRVLDLSSSWKALDNYYVDFNKDGETDYIRLLNDTTIQFNVSNGHVGYSLCNVSLKFPEGNDLSAASAATPVDIQTIHAPICSNKVGTLDVSGTTSSSSTLSDNLYVIVGDGDDRGSGAFDVEYLSKGPYFEDGLLNEGDVIQVTLVPHRVFTDDDGFILKLVPARGFTLSYNIQTPSVLKGDRINLVIG